MVGSDEGAQEGGRDGDGDGGQAGSQVTSCHLAGCGWCRVLPVQSGSGPLSVAGRVRGGFGEGPGRAEGVCQGSRARVGIPSGEGSASWTTGVEWILVPSQGPGQVGSGQAGKPV